MPLKHSFNNLHMSGDWLVYWSSVLRLIMLCTNVLLHAGLTASFAVLRGILMHRSMRLLCTTIQSVSTKLSLRTLCRRWSTRCSSVLPILLGSTTFQYFIHASLLVQHRWPFTCYAIVW